MSRNRRPLRELRPPAHRVAPTEFHRTRLVSAVNKFIIVKDGMESMAMALYTDTYIKEKGEWRCVQAQTTPVAEENYPPESTIVKKYIRGVLQ